MEAEDFFFEGFQAAGGGLNQEEVFAGRFDFTFPAVDGFHRGGVDVDASGDVFFEDGAGDFAGFGERRAGYEDEAELGGGWHGVRGKIVAGFWCGASGGKEDKDYAENAESAEDAEKKWGQEEEILWLWIVRAHPLQKTQRMGHPQVREMGDVRERRDCGRMWGLWLLHRWRRR